MHGRLGGSPPVPWRSRVSNGADERVCRRDGRVPEMRDLDSETRETLVWREGDVGRGESRLLEEASAADFSLSAR
jgi:hypothetical protein